MNSLDKEKLRTFVHEANVSGRYVEGMLLAHFIICIVVVTMGINADLTIICFSPFILSSIGIYLSALKTKPTQVKKLNLLIGLSGIILSITCIIACFLMVSYPKNVVWIGASSLIFLNLMIVLAMAFLSMRCVRRSKKASPASILGASLISLSASFGAVLGIWLSRNIDMDIKQILSLAFAFLSCVFSIFFIGIMRYYYGNVLERMDSKPQARNDHPNFQQ